MTERLIAGWGVRIAQACGCNGQGIRLSGEVCACAAGKRLRDAAAQQEGERKVLAGENR